MHCTKDLFFLKFIGIFLTVMKTTLFLTWKRAVSAFVVMFSLAGVVHGDEMVHPGMSHKTSDLERMKLMVEAEISPYFESFELLREEARASFDYAVEGDPFMTDVTNEGNRREFEADSKAAYFNALQWYITGDERHARKAVEIFNTWVNIQNVSTSALEAGIVYPILEAAEIIRHTYPGWSDGDIKSFEDMLVYPGYSNRAVPSSVTDDNGSFYWRAHMGEPFRAGNQSLSGWRAVMAIGIFLDNELIYDRAYRYVSGQNHRPDDLPYTSGPAVSDGIVDRTEFVETHDWKNLGTIEDYGYDGVISNYIWKNGQNAESSRDQGHPSFALGAISSISEMAWNQGDDLWTATDNRISLGMEHYLRYNLSFVKSFPDQLEPWEPTVESGEFISGFDRSSRSKLLAMNPFREDDLTRLTRGEALDAPFYELVYASLIGRGFEDTDSAKWIARTREHAIDVAGLERSDAGGAFLGFGGMTFRRPDGAVGDPISGFDTNGLPLFKMNVLPATINAENFDHMANGANGRSYSDSSEGNSGDVYRTDEDVDIQQTSDGDYSVTEIEDGEFLTYTVHVPEHGNYDISINQGSRSGAGSIQISFDGSDKTGTVTVPATGGLEVFKDFAVMNNVRLSEGVQSMKVTFPSAGFNFNTISVTRSDDDSIDTGTPAVNRNQVGTTDALDRSNWVVSASSGHVIAEQAIDGSVNSRWSTGERQSDGQWFEIDMSEPVSFNRIELDTLGSSLDFPREYTVSVSDDGSDWTAVATGIGRGALTTTIFADQVARYVRIEQSGSDDFYWWSIHEINIFGNGVDAEPVVPEPVDEDPVTPEPVDPEPVTPDPVDEDPVIVEPVVPDPVDEDPVAPEPVDEDPVVPEPGRPDSAERYVLDAESSSVFFVTTKNTHDIEAHHFTSVSGSISSETGEATLGINLNSVETEVDIRNERVRDLLFEVDSFSDAVATLPVDLEDLAAQEVGSTQKESVSAMLDLHGVSVAIDTELSITKLSDSQLMVQNVSPILIDAEDFDLTGGIEMLRNLANLPVISYSVPVNFTLLFNTSESE